MEEHLYSVLSAALTAPIAWGTLGEGTTTPRAVMYRVSGVRQRLLQGPGLMEGRVQIECYGKSYKEAVGLSREIRAVLEHYKGGPVRGMFLDSVRDRATEDVGLLHSVSMTFLVWHEEN